MMLKKIASAVLTLLITLTATSAWADWHQKNIRNYAENVKFGKRTGEIVRCQCTFFNDSRHRILVGEDWSNKISALGYKDDEVAYLPLSFEKTSGDAYADEGICKMEIILMDPRYR